MSAARPAYLLWATVADPERMSLAASGKLPESAGLCVKVEPPLADAGVGKHPEEPGRIPTIHDCFAPPPVSGRRHRATMSKMFLSHGTEAAFASEPSWPIL